MKYLKLSILMVSVSLYWTCVPSVNMDLSHQWETIAEDKYLWLEEVEGTDALAWVTEQNAKSLNLIQTDPRFQQFETEALAIYEAEDKLIYGTIRGEYVYNYWQDEQHIRGIWRRTSKDSYLTNKASWETLLDLDALAESEAENWVYKGVKVLPTNRNKCLFEFSRGGKDAVVIREFNIDTKTFVKDGFVLSEAKSDVSWISEDEIFVSTDFGVGSMTSSGYPATVRRWQRGTKLEDAPEVARVDSNYVGVWGWSIFTPEADYQLINKSIDFWNHEIFMVNTSQQLEKIQLPLDADFQGIWKGVALAILRSGWEGKSTGSLIGLNMETGVISEIYSPASKTSISSISLSKDVLLLTIQENVQGKVLSAKYENDQWLINDLNLPAGGVVKIFGSNSKRHDFFWTFNNLITPTKLNYTESLERGATLIQAAKGRFDTANLEVRQKFATSADGTKVPYFLVSKTGLTLNGDNPVLLYGYGGFEISQTPQYRSTTGKLWLEKGGVFELANIRGGGEYGPEWHQAALKMNRHKSFEDFIAIGEDLIEGGITSPKKLGMVGGSNGGLLVGAVFTLRPDLFNAMVCQVPLLDMMRYHKLLAGASWIGEYGDPDDNEMSAYLRGYSPYHNIGKQTKYPKGLFITSTKDDRVHPAHARKMVARLMENNHPVLYYENIEGGHATGANLKQHAMMVAIEYTYLHQMLMD